MRKYEKPVIIANDSLAEGVYAASGDAPSAVDPDCYTVTANIHQRPETGREDYRIQVNGHHNAADGHHSGEQHLFLSFNQPVNFSFTNGANGTCVGGNGTSTIEISYNYHNNANDNIGLGDVVVTSGDGLAITGARLTCNYNCGQH